MFYYIEENILAAIYATLRPLLKRPEKKNQAWTGFEPMTSAMLVQFST